MRADTKLRASDYLVDVSWRPVPFKGMADVARVAEAFDSGATLVIQAMHHWWPTLATFCRSLEATLGHPAQANAYYTPRSAQGLPIHHDTHDVFCLQIAGEKRWLVYEPVWELPLKNQRYDSKLGAPGEPVLDVTLRPGDTLYLPRGWLHEAKTSDTDSLHLTIGTNVYTWLDAFRAALEECADDAEFRRSPDGPAEELLARLGERLGEDDVRRRMRSRLVRSRRPVLDGQLAHLRVLRDLDSGDRARAAPDGARGPRRARGPRGAHVRGAHARVPCTRRGRAGVRAPHGRAVSPVGLARDTRRGGPARARRAPRARRAARQPLTTT